MQKKVLCAVAGASGGHIIPALFFIKEEASSIDADVLFFSSSTSFDQSILAQFPHTFTYHMLPIQPLPGKALWRYPQFLFTSMRAFFRSFRILRALRPEKVVSTGGFIGIPVCLAARLLGIKVQLFELNAVPGRAVRWLAPRADTIFVCFEEAAHYFDSARVKIVPYPLRFSAQDRIPSDQARSLLGLSSTKKILLVLGGSQGSQALNTLIKNFFEDYASSEIAVIHQTGAQAHEQFLGKDFFKRFYAERGIEAVVFDFVSELQNSYGAADLVVARAGAGTLFEVEFFNKRTILVPLEVAAEAHQLENAQAMMRKRPDLFFIARQKEVEMSPSKLHTLILDTI